MLRFTTSTSLAAVTTVAAASSSSSSSCCAITSFIRRNFFNSFAGSSGPTEHERVFNTQKLLSTRVYPDNSNHHLQQQQQLQILQQQQQSVTQAGEKGELPKMTTVTPLDNNNNNNNRNKKNGYENDEKENGIQAGKFFTQIPENPWTLFCYQRRYLSPPPVCSFGTRNLRIPFYKRLLYSHVPCLAERAVENICSGKFIVNVQKGEEKAEGVEQQLEQQGEEEEELDPEVKALSLRLCEASYECDQKPENTEALKKELLLHKINSHRVFRENLRGCELLTVTNDFALFLVRRKQPLFSLIRKKRKPVIVAALRGVHHQEQNARRDLKEALLTGVGMRVNELEREIVRFKEQIGEEIDRCVLFSHSLGGGSAIRYCLEKDQTAFAVCLNPGEIYMSFPTPNLSLFKKQLSGLASMVAGGFGIGGNKNNNENNTGENNGDTTQQDAQAAVPTKRVAIVKARNDLITLFVDPRHSSCSIIHDKVADSHFLSSFKPTVADNAAELHHEHKRVVETFLLLIAVLIVTFISSCASLFQLMNSSSSSSSSSLLLSDSNKERRQQQKNLVTPKTKHESDFNQIKLV